MNTENILVSQKEVVKNWKSSFSASPCDEGIKYIYVGTMSIQAYCEFMGLDYNTVARLGVVTYDIEYNCVEDKYILRCETYINGYLNENLTTEFEDTEDYLGFYNECMGGKKLDILGMSAEDLKKYLEENYDNYSGLEVLFRKEVDEEEIGEDYIKDNPSHAFSTALEFMGDYDTREALKEAIDSL